MSASPSDEDLRACLRERFGHADFRSLQLAVIHHVLAGRSALVLFPTGEGKSLCYQLPALLLEHLTVVVSPLIALMKDQVDALERRGVAATFINSSLARGERERRLRATAQGRFDMLYVTPERFRKGEFMATLRGLSIDLLVVDEAHCISQWGHDFRPDYAELGRIRRTLGSPPVLALSATATPAVQDDIRTVLEIDESGLFQSGIQRENLFLSAVELSGHEAKLERIHALLERWPPPGIIYTALIRDLHLLEEDLQRSGLHCCVYHGELSASERREMQERFMEADDLIVLATPAFGMGVDKADIRFVLHHQVPRNPESYYQEIGRSGRDGQGALCELLFDPEDLAIQQDFIAWSNPEREFIVHLARQLKRYEERLHEIDENDLRDELLVKNRSDNRVGVALRLLELWGVFEGPLGRPGARLLEPLDEGRIGPEFNVEKRRSDLLKLYEMVRYARLETCRKEFLHSYFGCDTGARCGACDRCLAMEQWMSEQREVARPSRPPVQARAPLDGPPRRGDWVRVNGRILGRVVRLSRPGGGRLIYEVELSPSLRIRRFDSRRDRIEHLQRDDPPGR